MSNLTRITSEKQISRLESPEVLSKANPSPDMLLQARADINFDPTLKKNFEQAREDGKGVKWLADVLAARLAIKWGPEYTDSAVEAAQFLADESFQIAPGISLVSIETGRVIAVISEEDVYQPAMVPREGGSMATPLPKVNPYISASVSSALFEAGREREILEFLAKKTHTTDLLKEKGDPRLLAATRKGRFQIVKSISEEASNSLLGSSSGSAKIFLKYLKEVPELEPDLEFKVHSVVTLGIQDFKSFNPLHVDFPNVLKRNLANGWVRAMAQKISTEAFRLNGASGDFDEVDLKVRFWVCPPGLRNKVRISSYSTLVVEGAKLLGLGKPFGSYTIGDVRVSSRELSGRWEVEASALVKVKADWGGTHCVDLDEDSSYSVNSEPNLLIIDQICPAIAGHNLKIVLGD